MYNLVFDTTAGACCVCLQKYGKALQTFSEDMDFGQAEALLPAIKDMLNKQNVAMSDLDAICVCTGPGSFTGVRACVSAARAFSLALPECKVIGVSAFEAYLGELAQDELAEINVVIIETKREDFYYQLFNAKKEPLCAPSSADYEDIIALLRGKKVSLVGDGVERFLSRPSGLSLHCIRIENHLPIESLADCAYRKYERKAFDFPKPLYIKAPDIGTKK